MPWQLFQLLIDKGSRVLPSAALFHATHCVSLRHTLQILPAMSSQDVLPNIVCKWVVERIGELLRCHTSLCSHIYKPMYEGWGALKNLRCTTVWTGILGQHSFCGSAFFYPLLLIVCLNDDLDWTHWRDLPVPGFFNDAFWPCKCEGAFCPLLVSHSHVMSL